MDNIINFVPFISNDKGFLICSLYFVLFNIYILNTYFIMRRQKVTLEFPVTHECADMFCEKPTEFKVMFINNEPCLGVRKTEKSKVLVVDTTIGLLPLGRFVSEPDHRAIFVEGLNGKQVAERIKSLGPDKVYTMEPQTKLSKERDFAYLVWKVY